MDPDLDNPNKAVQPDLDWYRSISNSRAVPTRCPFANVHRCPRYYQSLSLLGGAGITTSIPPEKDKELEEYWKKSDLWPVVDEHATGISGANDESTGFHNFCPEVAFDIFRLFASSLHRFSDSIDRDHRHQQRARERVNSSDWRWAWASVEPLHYTDCPLFSALTSAGKTVDRSAKEELVQLRPGVFGISVNLKTLWKELRRWFGARQSPRKKIDGTQKAKRAVDDRGLLDYIADAHLGLRACSEIANEVGAWFRRITPEVAAATKILSDESVSIETKRAKVQKLATLINKYATWLSEANKKYEEAIVKIQDGFTAMFSGEFALEADARLGLKRFVDAMKEAMANARRSHETFSGIIRTLEMLPRIEQDFNAAKRYLSTELSALARNVDKFVSVVEETTKAASRYLSATGPADDRAER